MGMQKGSRVTIISGNGKGQSGTIFWTGNSRYGDGERYGVNADDGETYWVDEEHVEASDAPAPAPDAGPTFEKGDRVRFKVRGQEGTGSVFWIGESRRGPGQRLGIRDDNDPDEAVWLDARYAEALDAANDPGAPAPAPRRSRARDDDQVAVPEEYGGGASYSDMPAPPPMDDGALDSLAATVDEGDDEDVGDMPF